LRQSKTQITSYSQLNINHSVYDIPSHCHEIKNLYCIVLYCIIHYTIYSLLCLIVYQAQNITTSITIPTISGTTQVQSVNGWIVIQQRVDSDEDFNQNWVTYRNGFGTFGVNYWMGNEKVFQLTSHGSYKLRMEMRSNLVGWVSAEYSYMYLDNEANKYRLHIGGFTGDCLGDSMDHIGYFHNGMKFTTYDSDNDMATTGNCAVNRLGAWWYNSCEWANFNGYYYGQFFWWDIPDPGQYLNVTRMMIKLV